MTDDIVCRWVGGYPRLEWIDQPSDAHFVMSWGYSLVYRRSALLQLWFGYDKERGEDLDFVKRYGTRKNVQVMSGTLFLSLKDFVPKLMYLGH